MQAAEGCIEETKLGFYRKIPKSGLSKSLWDYYIEPEAEIRPHTLLVIYSLEGQVPETLMAGHIGDISKLYEFKWFQC